MRYEKYLQLVEITSGRKKLEKLLDQISDDFAGINGRQYEALRFLIISKMYAA